MDVLAVEQCDSVADREAPNSVFVLRVSVSHAVEAELVSRISVKRLPVAHQGSIVILLVSHRLYSSSKWLDVSSVRRYPGLFKSHLPFLLTKTKSSVGVLY